MIASLSQVLRENRETKRVVSTNSRTEASLHCFPFIIQYVQFIDRLVREVNASNGKKSDSKNKW